LLKAQLVRITFSTTLVPNGMYKKNEDDEKIIELEEAGEGGFNPPGFDELKTTETWVHLHPNILSTGRITHYIPKTVGEDDKEDFIAKLDEAEEKNQNIIERLVTINEDKVIYPGGVAKEDEDEDKVGEKFESNWLVKIRGDQQVLPPTTTLSYSP